MLEAWMMLSLMLILSLVTKKQAGDSKRKLVDVNAIDKVTDGAFIGSAALVLVH